MDSRPLENSFFCCLFYVISQGIHGKGWDNLMKFITFNPENQRLYLKIGSSIQTEEANKNHFLKPRSQLYQLILVTEPPSLHFLSMNTGFAMVSFFIQFHESFLLVSFRSYTMREQLHSLKVYIRAIIIPFTPPLMSTDELSKVKF